MEVAKVAPSTHSVSNEKEAVKVDGEAFSQEFSKFSGTTETQSDKPTDSETDFEMSANNEVEETTEKDTEEEPLTFTVINPFMQLDSELQSLSIDSVEFLSHSSVQTEKNSELTETAEQIQVSEVLADNIKNEEMLSDSIISKEMKTLEELSKSESKVMEKVSLPKQVQAKEGTDKQDKLTDELKEWVKQADNVLDDGKEKTVKNSTKKLEQTVSVDGLNKKENAESTKQAPFNRRVNTDFQPNTEETQKMTETVSKQVSNESKEVVSELTPQALDRQPSTNKVTETVQPTNQAEVFVSKEEGFQIVEEMVTKLIQDENGTDVYQSTIRLKPENLGEVTIELSLNEKGLDGKLSFQSEETKQWFEGEWKNLRMPLESKGLTLNSFDFSVNEQAVHQQNAFEFSQDSSHSDQQKASNHGSINEESKQAEEKSEEHEIKETLIRTQGINVYA